MKEEVRMNDEERLTEIVELKEIATTLADLPQLLTKFDRLRFRLMWLMRMEEVIPHRLIPVLDPRKVRLAEDVIAAVERKILRRTQSSMKSDCPANMEL
jgi:hypothetical protein